MATSADLHAAVAGAGTPPSDSPPAAKKAGAAAAAAWKRPGSATVPAVVAVGNPIMDADSWPALPGLASPPPPAAAAVAKASPKATPPPSTGAVISPVSLGNSGASDANPENEAPVRNPGARRALVMPAGDGLEKSAAAPELSPVYVPNVQSNGGYHYQNGRFGNHPHGRGGGYGGGNRRGNAGGGGRRGQENHGSFDGPRRGGGRRDGHGQTHQQRGHQPSYIRAPHLAVVPATPPPPPPFVSPATQSPHYGAPMGFPEMAPHVYYFPAHPSEGVQVLPFVPHPTSPQTILIDPIRKELLVQIDYYFSDDNLCKDPFLRQNMDDQGWVPLSLIAGFRKVRKLTNNIQFILETVQLSNVVEVQGDKIRRRGTWESWLLPKASYVAGCSSGSSFPVTSNIDSLASQFKSVRLEGATYHTSMQGMPGEAHLTRSTTSISLGYHVPTLGGLHNTTSGPPFEQKVARNLLRSDTF
ncbi:la-related protein 1B-like isoform X2 [Phragmites australis]|uniref:la-related protein 1B-like isoform X2 n=1 Tax=Phragmites australis TaxID=29695 RepID=UPI002D775433|nr:la-related protein 1B-like isoform X2 [Phragmites australis]